jgi:hypothetical protein
VNVLAIPESCPGTDVAWGSGKGTGSFFRDTHQRPALDSEKGACPRCLSPVPELLWLEEAGRGLAPFSELLIKELLLIPKKVPVPVV